MTAHALCWLPILGCWLFGNAIATADVPSYFKAESYAFELTLGQANRTFFGSATIVLNTNDETDTRSKNLVLSGSGLDPKLAKIEYANKRVILVPSTDIKVMGDTITIPGKEFLLKNSTYKITFNYTGWEDTSGGIFSKIFNKSVYYGTKLYPIYGKRVFPCLDQPGNRASISLSVTVPKTAGQPDPVVVSGLQPVSNSGTPSTVIYNFKSQSAIAVSSIFFTAGAYTKIQKSNVWVPTALSSDTKIIESALNVNEVKTLLSKTQEIFPSVNLLAVVVPGLGSDTDSGLGISAFSIESSMGVNKAKAIEALRAIYRSLYVSLLMPKSWQDIWIPESISLHLASKTFTEISGLEDWKNMNPEFVVNALEDTWSLDSTPILKNFTDPSQVDEYLKSSAIKKGASVLAMLGSVLAEGMDIEIYNSISLDFFGDQMSSSEFLTSYADYGNLNDLPGNKTLGQILEPWLSKPGYPAVSITRKESDILAGQSLFGNSGKSEDVTWIVPINFRQLTASQSNQIQAGDLLKWMTPLKNADFKLLEKVSNKTTVSLNSQGTGLYRTLYDDKDIELLGEILTYNSGLLDSRSRATLLRDLFAFIKTGNLKYSVVLGLLQYLGNEDSLEPWSVAIQGLEELRRLVYFKDSETLDQVHSVAGDYLRYTYLKMPISSSIFYDSPVQKILSSMVAKWLCTYDDYTCKYDAIDVYKNYIATKQEDKITNKDIIPVVYCNKLLDVKSEEFKTLMAHYNPLSSVEDRRNVLSYLACPQDNTTINWYLTTFMSNNSSLLPDDIVVAFEELAGRLEHLDLCFSFLNSNFASLHEELTEEHKAKLINILGNLGSSDTHLNLLKNFPDANSTLIKNELGHAIKNVEDRQKFLSDNYHDIVVGLFGYDPSPGPGPNPSPSPRPGPGPDPGPGPNPPTPTPTPKSSAPSSAAVIASLIPMAVIALVFVH